MAIVTAVVLTSWRSTVVDGVTENVPAVSVDYPLLSYVDITGQQLPPRNPNWFLLIASLQDTVLTQIVNDAIYRVVWDSAGLVILPDRVPNAQQFKRLRDFLLGQGFTQAWVDGAIGTTVGGRTITQIANALLAALGAL